MASTIVTKNSSTASAVPLTGDLTQGELAVNVTDKRLFTKNSGGTVVELGINPSSLTMSGGTANGVAYLNGSKVVTTGSALTFNGTDLGVGTASPPSKLSVYAATGGSTTGLTVNASGNMLNLFGSSSTNAGVIFDATDGTVGSATGVPMIYRLGGSEQMRLTSTGLGIGTSSPSQLLQARKDQAAYTWMRVDNQTNSASAYAGLAIGANGNTWGITVGSSAANSNALNFVLDATGTNASKMTLDSSGNLGLGVTPSAWFASNKALQINTTGVLSSYTNGANIQTFLANNAFWNASGTISYITSNTATSYTQDNGAHKWYYAPSGTAGNAITFTQAMTLDASGRLVIGGTTAISDAGITIANDSSGGATVKLSFSTTTTERGSISMGGGSGELKLTSGYSGYGGFTTFYTNGSERARIDSSGNLLVGTTSGSTHTLQKDNANDIAADIVNSSSSNCYGLRVRYSSVTPNTVGYYFYRAQDSSATRFEVYSNGGIANYQANDSNLSDRREKTNFAPASEYLSKICAIPVQTFKYIDQTDNEPNLGVVAQDVQAVAPELVTESNWGTEDEPKMRLSIYQTDLQYALMKCIQEQQALITQLTERITALESK